MCEEETGSQRSDSLKSVQPMNDETRAKTLCSLPKLIISQAAEVYWENKHKTNPKTQRTYILLRCQVSFTQKDLLQRYIHKTKLQTPRIEVQLNFLNRNAEGAHPCLDLDHRGKASHFSRLSTLLVVGLCRCFFIELRKFASIGSLLRVFIMNGCHSLSNAFSAPINMIISFYFFRLLMWWITLIFKCLTNFAYLEYIPLVLGV